MTYILNSTERRYTAMPAARFAARIATQVKMCLTIMARASISLPSAVGAAFAMTYVDPYQRNLQQKDQSDPANF